MGVEYPLSVHITKILMVGQAVNLVFSAPGNSITPNIGIPKFQMFEGLIQLAINLIVSIILIINFGILGAAYGNTIAVIISSLYIFFVSSGFFKTGKLSLLYSVYLKPVIACLVAAVGSHILFIFVFSKFIAAVNRSSGLMLIFLTGAVFLLIYVILILVFKYLNKNDKTLIFNTLAKFIPPKIIDRYKTISTYEYKGELVSFFVVTHNRLKMLKQCTNSLLNTIKNLNYELIIWDNNSIDDTKSFLSELSKSDRRIKVVLHPENAGTNAKGLAADMCRGDYIFGIDDDVLEYPDDWVLNMLSAYNCIPFMGYLATDVHQNEFTNGAKFGLDKYVIESYCGGKYNLLVGPTGGWCFLISRKVYNEVGKFLILNDRVFFAEDGDYGYRVLGKGLKTGILEGVKVFHATGDYYNKEYANVLTNKYKSFNLPLPTAYKIERKLKIIFSLKKLYRKIIDSSLSRKS
jgi:GT2 family glycosyltransferase